MDAQLTQSPPQVAPSTLPHAGPLSTGNAIDTAARDVVNSAIGPVAGPAVRFASVTATGSAPAVNVRRVAPVAEPGESQTAKNVVQGLKDMNPIVASYLDKRSGKPWSEALSRQLPRFTLSPGKAPEMVANYPQIVGLAQTKAYADFLALKARELGQDERSKFLSESLEAITDDAQKAHVMRLLRSKRVIWSQVEKAK